MIDRSHPVAPLTLPWNLNAFYVGAAICLAFLTVFLVLHALGILLYAVCALWVGIVYVLLYLIALTPVVAGVAILIAAGKSGGKGETGCGGLLVILFSLWFLGKTLAWAGDTAGANQASTMAQADGGWGALHGWSNVVISDVFMYYQVFLWCWLLLAGSLTVSAGTLALIGAARMESVTRRVFRGVRWQCPRCPTAHPQFLCPGCGARHEPIATRYGIFKAKCKNCGTSIGTTSLSGLLRLTRVCSGCSITLDHPDLGHLPEYHIAIVGAKNSGKTNLIVSAIHTLETQFAVSRGMTLSFANRAEEQDYRARAARLLSGRAQDQTQRSNRPVAFTIALKPNSGGGGALLYLYDAAGEDFQAGDVGQSGISGHDFHRIVDGILLVVDPFAEEGVRRATQGEHGRLPDGTNPAPYDATYVLGRVMPFWNRTHNVSAQGRFEVPIAVVLTKLDVCHLDHRVGGFPELGRAPAAVSAIVAEATRFSAAVRRLLAENGSNDLLQLVDSHFRTANFFGSTAFGRMADPSDPAPFRPGGTDAPLVWLLAEVGALSDSLSLLQTLGRAKRYISRGLRGAEGKKTRLASWAMILGPVGLVFVCVWFFLM